MANVHLIIDEYILPDITAFANNRRGHDMTEMPDFGAISNAGTGVHHRAGMDKKAIFHYFFNLLVSKAIV